MLLKMECSKCSVADNCPERGASPLHVGNTIVYCHLVGGYGRVPLDLSLLSEESKKKALVGGECLTIAEVPHLDGEYVEKKIVKIFAPPVLHAREKTSIPKSSDLQPTSYVDRSKV